MFVILFLMQRAGALWWLYAWIVWVAFTVLITWAWPTLIAPLFNKFTPLSDETLEAAHRSPAAALRLLLAGVFVMDGSRRSVHGNAYFTGVGRSKRIVFFDTLLERLQIAEVEAVLAHELGHFRLHHVRWRLVLSLAFGLRRPRPARRPGAVAGFLSRVRRRARLRRTQRCCCSCSCCQSSPTSLTPLGAWWSRKHEFEADEFAAQFADARQLAEALVKLYRDNATTLTPDRLHSAFYDSHPPALVRISRLQQTRSADMSGDDAAEVAGACHRVVRPARHRARRPTAQRCRPSCSANA